VFLDDPFLIALPVLSNALPFYDVTFANWNALLFSKTPLK